MTTNDKPLQKMSVIQIEIEKALDIIEKENIKLRDGDYFK